MRRLPRVPSDNVARLVGVTMKGKSVRWLFLLALFTIAALPVAAQEDAVVPVTASNVTQLQPDVAIDFDNLPPEAGTILSGGFALDGAGQRLALRNRDNDIVVFSTVDGAVLDVFNVP